MSAAAASSHPIGQEQIYVIGATTAAAGGSVRIHMCIYLLRESVHQPSRRNLGHQY